MSMTYEEIIITNLAHMIYDMKWGAKEKEYYTSYPEAKCMAEAFYMKLLGLDE